ncbi:MAG: transposase, partial [Deltaproteobacteria bacterium]|nr:transposase [Deltaproteobacteria bacterium]
RDKKLQLPWDEVLTDLDAFKAVHFQWDDREYLPRTECQGCAHGVFQAVGVKPPPTLQPISL